MRPRAQSDALHPSQLKAASEKRGRGGEKQGFKGGSDILLYLHFSRISKIGSTPSLHDEKTFKINNLQSGGCLEVTQGGSLGAFFQTPHFHFDQ